MSVYDELAELEEMMREVEAEKAEIVIAETALRNRRAQAKIQEDEIKARRFDLMREKRAADRLAEELERQRQLEALNIAKANELAYVGREIDERTANAKWRERAMPHQIDGGKFLATAKRALCADGMGVGKTLQSLMFLDMVGSKRALIVCQGDVMTNFVDEMKRFTDRPIGIVGKIPKAAANIVIDNYGRFMPEFVMVVNFEAWYRNRDILNKLKGMRFDTVIVDEAHNIKETDGLPYKGVEQIIDAENACPICRDEIHLNKDRYIACTKCTWTSAELGDRKLRRSVDNVLMMTGTPILNRPDELYPLLHLINEDIFPHKNSFLNAFCTYDDNGKTVWRQGGESMLSNKISGFYLRRTHETAGIVLPPQGTTIHEIEFDAELYPLQARIMKMLRDDAQVQISEGKAVTLPDLLSLITRERQAAVWPGGIRLWEQATEIVIDEATGESRTKLVWDYAHPYADGSPRPEKIWIPVGDMFRESMKLDRAVELIKQLNDDGRRVVIFSQFKSALEELNGRLGDRSVRFDGDTDQGTREAVKRNFNREFGEVPVWDNVLCNYKTGGVGLNLTAATAVVVLDYEWNQGKLDQAYARINRIGQTEDTQVHILKLVGTIEEWMDKLIARKSEVTGGFAAAMAESDQFKADFADELRKMLEG